MRTTLRKSIWVITVLLIIASIVVDIFFGPRIVTLDNSQPTAESILTDYFFSIITTLLIGLFISLLISNIPYKKLNYRLKFRLFLPIGVSISCLFVIYALTSSAYYRKKTGHEFKPLKLYSLIKAERDIRCDSLKNGMFKTKDLIIERKGDLQTQTDIKTGEKIDLRIEWLGDCEYLLLGFQGENKTLKVKIVDITDEYYDYYSASDLYATRGRVWFKK